MDDLISEFITETSESLSVLDLELVKLEQNPSDQGILGNIFRLVHTIKGTCGFLGLPRLESVAHAGENVLGKVRDGEIVVTEHTVSIVLEAIDRIKNLLEYLSANGREAEGEDKDLIARLNAFAQTGALPSAPPVAAPAPAAALELNVSTPFSPEVMDELERAFANATSTVEGGIDFSKAPAADALVPAADALEAHPPVVVPALTEQVKEKAIRQGLDAPDVKEVASGSGGGQTQTIRVNLDVLENLMQMVGELVLTRNQLLQVVRHRDDRELKAPLQQLSQITSELQESVMKTRMQPIGTAWSKFPRLIRDLTHELNKKIDLKMIGEATELDRQLLEMIKDPLTHMVRNSCDHGLEIPAERLAAGKPEVGTVTLSAYHEGGHIIIEITDDGRGLNIDRIKQKAIEKGLAGSDELAQMSDDQIMQFVFKAGFSTAEKITSVSGRGVGMDVVRTNIEKIGGTVSLTSAMGKGSTFHIKIPLTLAIVSVLLIAVGNQQFAIPQINVLELVRVGPESDYKIEAINHSSVLRLRDKLLPLVSLRDVLQLGGANTDESSYIAVLRVGTNDFGVVIDKVYDTEEIVVKPVSRAVGELDVYSGNTILGDGSVIMILDPNGIARTMGERDPATQNIADVNAAVHERQASFLVFKAGPGAPKAVPLELVSRLEVIDSATIEHSGHDAVVQYRGDLMRLKVLPESVLPTTGSFDAVVFTYDGRTVGLVVDEIVDIVRAPLAIAISTKDEQYLGSSVIAGKTTDVVDVGYLLRDLVRDLEHSNQKVFQVTGKRLLLVEDSMFFRKLLVPFLSNIGFDVVEAAAPSQALEIVGSQPKFDIVVTDIEMPEMDGFELCSHLRVHPRTKGIPVIAFTSTVNEHFKMRGRQVGMSGVILKTDREALVKAIEDQIHLAREVA